MNGLEYIYVINREARTDRMQLFKEQAAEVGIPYGRISAIEGGADGCRASHLLVATIARNKKLPYYIVFEDDAEFVCDFMNKYSKAIKEVPPDWDMVYLGGSYGQFEKISDNVLRLTWCLTTHALLISAKFYDVFISTLEHDKSPCDVALNSIIKDYKVYGLSPCLVTQRPGISDITNKYEDYSKTIQKVI